MFQLDKKEVVIISKQKDITKFYDILDIKNGVIKTKTKNNCIYEVSPCLAINKNIEQEQNIYSSYLSAIKMLNFGYQIISETKQINFNSMLSKLDNNYHASNNDIHRQVIDEYKKYLCELSNNISVYDKTFYLVTEQLEFEKERALKTGFASLDSIGINVNNIKSDENIFKIIYEMINKR